MEFPACENECYKASKLCSKCQDVLASWTKFDATKIHKSIKPCWIKIIKVNFLRKHRKKKISKNALPTKNPVDKLAEIARKYGVPMSDNRRSVARSCVKICHPDKKNNITEEDKSNYTYLLSQI